MNIIGMNATTGKRMEGMEHIAQSIRDILTTRVGTRVMRREYGSMVPELIDQPGNKATALRLMAASVLAIRRWEPRVIINKTEFSIGMDGQAELALDGIRRDGPRNGQTFNLNVPLTK